MMLSQLTRFAKRLWARLSTAAHQVFRHLTQPASSNLVTGTLADLPRRRSELLVENALLRQQLIVLHRQVKTPRLTWRDRLSLLFLARLVPNWKQVLQIVQPETLLRWHRTGFRLFWQLKSRSHKPAHRLDPDTIALVQRLARENRLWGAERIRGELLKLGIRVAKRTIQKYMHAVRSQSPTGQSWSTFLKTHGQDIWACDFMPVITLFFQTLYAFVIVHVGSRRVVHVNATAHPTDAWVAQQLREATPFGETAKHLICDNDPKFGPVFEAAAKTCGLEVIHTPHEAPRAHATCERFVGSVRRECLDHLLVLGNRQLVRVLVEYAGYFNPSRPHQGLAQQTPDSRQSGQAAVATGKGIARPTSPTAPVQLSSRKLMAVPVLNGLHHSYAWVT
jgi:putative transposase